MAPALHLLALVAALALPCAGAGEGAAVAADAAPFWWLWGSRASNEAAPPRAVAAAARKLEPNSTESSTDSSTATSSSSATPTATSSVTFGWYNCGPGFVWDGVSQFPGEGCSVRACACPAWAPLPLPARKSGVPRSTRVVFLRALSPHFHFSSRLCRSCLFPAADSLADPLFFVVCDRNADFVSDVDAIRVDGFPTRLAERKRQRERQRRKLAVLFAVAVRYAERHKDAVRLRLLPGCAARVQRPTDQQ
jgi:hypothetical protein